MEWILLAYLISDEIAVRPMADEAQCVAEIAELRRAGGGAMVLESGETVDIVWAQCVPAEVVSPAVDGVVGGPAS